MIDTKEFTILVRKNPTKQKVGARFGNHGKNICYLF